jgi:hypothetical protein
VGLGVGVGVGVPDGVAVTDGVGLATAPLMSATVFAFCVGLSPPPRRWAIPQMSTIATVSTTSRRRQYTDEGSGPRVIAAMRTP